jgi:rhodanese-related sulfurtransferase
LLHQSIKIKIMLDAFKSMLGIGPKVDYKELMNNGAIIVDVRSKGEFAGGHVKDAVNIPVDQLPASLAKLKDKNQPVITCCASGMRSASAKSFLVSKGYTQVYNAGPWTSLNGKL